MSEKLRDYRNFVLQQEGFTPREAQVYSKYPFNNPTLKRIRRERRDLKKQFDRQGINRAERQRRIKAIYTKQEQTSYNRIDPLKRFTQTRKETELYLREVRLPKTVIEEARFSPREMKMFNEMISHGFLAKEALIFVKDSKKSGIDLTSKAVYHKMLQMRRAEFNKKANAFRKQHPEASSQEIKRKVIRSYYSFYEQQKLKRNLQDKKTGKKRRDIDPWIFLKLAYEAMTHATDAKKRMAKWAGEQLHRVSPRTYKKPDKKLEPWRDKIKLRKR